MADQHPSMSLVGHEREAVLRRLENIKRRLTSHITQSEARKLQAEVQELRSRLEVR
jgi:hypothetical protein